MGTLHYGGTEQIDLPDQLLAHVKVVMISKLRRNESFTLSWNRPNDAGAGRTTIWLEASVPLRFVFETADAEPLDPQLLQQLAREANTARGLVIDLEPSEVPALEAV
ncbi:hypothetical protein ACFPER_06415 [Agromyces aurantiacus]|uniref:DUF7882 domain-containing protein n=1 Tax=Agromyces aurantiacus TaxID=165814 RepID=A0ABV9R4B4_9MICO|nr:hypothetical protein [Agromyces aurantiacus]MBM7503097.1 hypothetical protein [Agromyces aurantiacus]